MSAVRVRHRPPPFAAKQRKAARRSAKREGWARGPQLRLAGQPESKCRRKPQPAKLLRFHGPVRKRLLRYPAIERHVRMRAEPRAVLLVKHHGGAAGPLKLRSILMVAGGSPGRDDRRHRGVSR